MSLFQSSLRRALLGIPLAAAICLPAAAAELAELRAAGDRLEWQPRAAGGAYRLVVAGAGLHWSRQLDAGGERLELPLFDDAGQPLPDGTYTWQLTRMPGVIEGRWHDPANGRDGGRPLAERPSVPERAPTQVGSFTVVGGRLLAAETEKPGAGRGARGDHDPKPSRPDR